MGCAASRLDNEDTVRRCKERRRLMKDAVYSRHYLASAHSDYLRSLRLTGSALTRFAAGEPLSVSEPTPAVLLHHLPYTATAAAPSTVSSFPPPTPAFSIPPPPHPPYTPSITNSKLPHILSDSSVPSTPSAPSSAPAQSASKRHHSNRFPNTPSQASSAWDWENFYPPSPPGSDYFNQLKEEVEDEDDSDDEPEETHLPDHAHEDRRNGSAASVRVFRHGHYCSSTSSSTKSDCDDDEEEEERRSRSEGTATRSDFGGSSSVDVRSRVRPAPSETGSAFTPVLKSINRERSEFGCSSAGWNDRDESSAAGDLRLVVGHRDLAGIVASLDEYFVKAASAGEPVCHLLEIGRAQLDRSFRQLKKTVYHSNSLLSALSSSFSSKPPLSVRYQLDTSALEDSGVEKSHGSTLERLLAWEKKLYGEVKF